MTVSEWLLISMFLFLLAGILSGYPVAFSLAGVSILFGALGQLFDVFHLSDFSFIPFRVFAIMSNFTLISVPLFILMGMVLEKTKLAQDLVLSMGELLSSIRGGTAFSVVFIGALLAASSGIVGATVVTLGLLSLPSMLKLGYEKKLSLGIIASSGTLGQIIPPSIVLILLGDMMNIDIGDLFVAAIVPSLLLVFLYILYIFLYSFIKPSAVPKANKIYFTKEKIKYFLSSLIAPVILLILVLGSIFLGIATPMESAACGATCAFLIAFLKKRLSFVISQKIFWDTTKITSMVFLLLIGAQFFAIVFRGFSGDEFIQTAIESFNLSPFTVLFCILLLLFLLGFFLDFIEICFILVPIAAPILIQLDFNPLWLAVLFAINLQTSFLTPPFGFSLFYLKSICPPQVKTTDIYKGIIPFVIIQIFTLLLVLFEPRLALYLPEVVFSN